MITVREIDSGGFGKVDVVRFPSGELAARKTFSVVPGGTEEEVDRMKWRFKKEVSFQQALKGDFFLPIIDEALWDDPMWFTMPLAERNLREQIIGWQPRNAEEARPLFEILEGLEALHAMRAVHRDLKPENVLLWSGKWRLIDFGLVFHHDADDSFHTSGRSRWGTISYMAPEQHRDFHDVSAATDIYAFGCILHDIFARGEPRVPYQRYTADGLLGHLIEACTEVNPHHRLRSVAEVRAELEAALTDPRATGGRYVDWTAAMEDAEQWEPADARAYLRAVENSEANVRAAALKVLNASAVERVYLVDHAGQIWERIADPYCEFVREGSFHCREADDLARTLWAIFELGSPRLKTKAILATARVGSSCNQWYVMDQLFAMADRRLDDEVARRVALEIRRLDMAHDFLNCLGARHTSIADYHLRIASAVAPS